MTLYNADDMGGTCSMVLEKNAYIILVGEPDGMRPRGMFTCRLEDNIKVDLKSDFWCESANGFKNVS